MWEGGEEWWGWGVEDQAIDSINNNLGNQINMKSCFASQKNLLSLRYANSTLKVLAAVYSVPLDRP